MSTNVLRKSCARYFEETVALAIALVSGVIAATFASSSREVSLLLGPVECVIFAVVMSLLAFMATLLLFALRDGSQAQ